MQDNKKLEELNKRISEEGWLKDSGSHKKRGLKIKVFIMGVSLVAAAVLIFAILGVVQFVSFATIIADSASEQDKVIADTMTDTMRDVSTGTFQKYVESDAEIIDNEFRDMKHTMELLAVNVQDVMEHPENYGETEVLRPEQAEKGKCVGQLLFSRNADRSDKDMLKMIRQIGNLQPGMRNIVEKYETMNDCLIALPEGATLYMDRHPEQKLDEDGNAIYFEAQRRPYYVGAALNGTTFFAPTNYDYFNDSMEVMIGVPVFINGELKAVCGGSRLLSDMEEMIEKMDLSADSYICLINETGNVVYSQMKTGELSINKSNRGSVLNSSNIELVEFIENALHGGKGCEKLTVNDEPVYIAYAPLKTVGWTLLLGISEEALEKPANALVSQVDDITEKAMAANDRMAKRAQYVIILIAIVLVFLSMIVSFKHSERLVRPILQLKDAGIKFIEREGMMLEHAPDYFGKLDLYTGDEIEDLWVTMQDLEINIVTTVRSLQRVTAEKERIDTELSVATKIQSDMLPKIFPAFPEKSEFDIYSTMDPAKEVGGDFYDFFLIDDDHLAVVIADVSGKGVPAALFMVIAKTIIKNVTLSGQFAGPGEILYDVNNRLCEGNDEDMFVTVWLGILTISTGHLVSASGGHEYPAICPEGGSFTLVKDIHGPGLGTFEDVDFEECTLDLNKGDLLFLYTDGIPEATNADEELFGIDRMLEALNKIKDEESLETMHKRIRGYVNEFVGEAPQFDDLTMTILRYKG